LVGGEAETLLHTATRPGQAQLGVGDCVTTGAVSVSFTPLAAFSAQLHVHGSLSEGTGTMRGFSDNAHLDGLDLLWWTDHDVLYHKNPDISLRKIDWENGQLEGEMPGSSALRPQSWVVRDLGGPLEDAGLSVDTIAAATGVYGLRAVVREGVAGVDASRRWRIHARNLTSIRGTLGGVQLAFRVRREHADRAQLRIVVPLSTADDGEGEAGSTTARRIIFYDGELDTPRDQGDLYVPMETRPKVWTEVRADISALAAAEWPEAERDLSARFFDIELTGRIGATAAWDLDDFRMSQRVAGDALREAQRGFLDEIADAQGVSTRSWVGAELSGFGEPHLNAFGSDGLLLDYDRAANWGPADAVAEIHDQGGIVSFNHMFGVGMAAFSEAERAEMVDDQLALLSATNVYGADLLEVGYRRRGGLTDDYLQVWDGLSIGGHYVTGIGTSDVHNGPAWESSANNFVTWIAAGELEEAALLWNLRRGAAWFGDPREFPEGEVLVSVEVPAVGASQGQVVVGRQLPTEVVFSANVLKA
jgi:hypothetical protein